MLKAFIPYVLGASIEHRSYETGLGNRLESDITLVVNYLRKALHVFVENKSQQKSGSAIEKIIDRLERMEAASFVNAMPMLMILDVRNQNIHQLNRIESAARERHIGLLYRQDLTKTNLQRVVREQMRFLSMHDEARAIVLGEDNVLSRNLRRGSDEYDLVTQFDLYTRRASFIGRCKEKNFIQ